MKQGRITTRRLGRDQVDVLHLLKGSDWRVNTFNAWSWTTSYRTTQILESLRKRGLVELEDGTYRISGDGREVIA